MTEATAPGLLAWPCAHPITQPWGYDPTYPGALDRFHRGLDLGCNNGSALVAPCNAVVQVLQDAPHGVAGCLDGGWGLVLRFHLPDGRVLDFCHLSEVVVDSGAKVKRGYVVAYSGASGIPGVTVVGPHLHVQAWESLGDTDDGSKRVDPTGWFNERHHLCPS